MAEEAFKLWFPTLSITKTDDGKLGIRGVVSTERKDLEDEKVLQNGLDWSYFKDHGHFRWKHTPKPKDGQDDPRYATVGTCSTIKNGTYKGHKATQVEGELYDDETGRAIHGKQMAMQKAGRGYGFSLEGSIVQRVGPGGKTIKQAKIRNIAIDPHPTNQDAQMEAFARALQPLDGDPDGEHADQVVKAKAKADDDNEEPDEDEDEEPKVEGEEQFADLEQAITSETIAPLATESLEGKKTDEALARKKKKKKKDDPEAASRGGRRKNKPNKEGRMTPEELRKQLDGMPAEERKELLSHYDTGGGPDKNDEVAKALAAQEMVMEGLGKALGVTTVELPDAIEDVTGGLKALGDGVADIRDTQDASAEAMMAMGELVKAQTEAMFSMRDELGELREHLDEQGGKIDEVSKAMTVPIAQLQRGQTSAVEPIPAPAETGEAELMSKAEAQVHLGHAIRKAFSEGNDVRRTELAAAMQRLDTQHGMVRKLDITKLTGTGV